LGHTVGPPNVLSVPALALAGLAVFPWRIVLSVALPVSRRRHHRDRERVFAGTPTIARLLLALPASPATHLIIPAVVAGTIAVVGGRRKLKLFVACGGRCREFRAEIEHVADAPCAAVALWQIEHDHAAGLHARVDHDGRDGPRDAADQCELAERDVPSWGVRCVLVAI
jgi:hypothetical protein